MTETTKVAPTEEVKPANKSETANELSIAEPAIVNLYDLFETDVNAGEDGKWYEPIPGVAFKLRRYTSNASLNSRRRLLTALQGRMKGMKAGDELPASLDTEMQIEQMAEAIVADWKGVTDRDGNELPFTRENARKVLTDLPDLRTLLSEYAGNIENYRVENLEEAAGNS